jgi:phage gp36-like protein
MPYCTFNDIKDQIPEANIIQLTDDEGFGVVNQARVDKAISTADSIIDGYLRGRYSLPLSTVPELIKTIAIDIAIFKLYERRLELEMPEAMMARYKNALKMLEQIQKGLIKLGIESPDTGPGQGHYKTNKTAGDRLFNKSLLERF